MAALDGILKAIGLATPFLYAWGAYQLFHWLDKKASDPAKNALAGTLKIMEYDNKHVASALLEVFDRIYSKPLLHWRALVRSVIFTVVVSVIYGYEVGVLREMLGPHLLPSFLVNAISDYVALFLIRRWLLFCGRRPILALTSGTILGGLVVLLGAVVRTFITIVMGAGWNLTSMIDTEYREFWFTITIGVTRMLAFVSVPAVIVFAWLPLFATAILVIRALHPIAAAVGGVQWFLKGGKEHPLEAIGYVAAAIVFPIAALWQYILKPG